MGARGVDELQAIVDYACAAGIGNRLQIDPSLARGLSYYTGAIMEISVKDLAGSLGGGGRYDNLVGMFASQDIPACGFSLGLERILVVMSERGMFPESIGTAGADVMVAIWSEESLGDSLKLAQDLRSAGLRVDLYPEADKLGKQFKYASSRAVSFVAVVGDEERARGEVAIKDLRSGDQQSIKRASVAAELRRKLVLP
jgi:histidyl-tRNA synthetase